ncbi:MAG: hypothetical protein OXI87_05710 [Albidovulum sp.]|nr:hypothetical protein [Albidovulum sp.]MDE0531652.1 hypothetical protein [Albidovulum sp.]
MPEEDKPGLKKRLWKEVATRARVPDAWFRKCRETLKHDKGGVDLVVGAVRRLRSTRASCRADLERVLKVFRKNRSRVRYCELRDRFLPIGSGMRWSVAGRQAIFTFRAMIKSERFDRAREGLAANGNQPLAA